MLFVLPQDRLKLRQRVVEAALLARDAAQLEMRVGGIRVDRHRVAETCGGLGDLAALLVDQPKLVLRVAIVRIDGGGLEHATQALAAAQPRAKVAQFPAQEVPGVKQEEGRGEPSEQVTARWRRSRPRAATWR